MAIISIPGFPGTFIRVIGNRYVNADKIEVISTGNNVTVFQIGSNFYTTSVSLDVAINVLSVSGFTVIEDLV